MQLLIINYLFFRTCEPTCGGTLSADKGDITSPGYPDSYPINKKCTWTIFAPTEYKITLTFHDFNIEGKVLCCIT